MDKNRNYETKCPGCGKAFRGKLDADEHRKSFVCSLCTTRFSITFDYPSREQLEKEFLSEESPTFRPIFRLHKAIQEGFPFRLPRLGAARHGEKPIFKGKKR